jgi:molybdopterin biosynthesis enzyme MoaB
VEKTDGLEEPMICEEREARRFRAMEDDDDEGEVDEEEREEDVEVVVVVGGVGRRGEDMAPDADEN